MAGPVKDGRSDVTVRDRSLSISEGIHRASNGVRLVHKEQAARRSRRAELAPLLLWAGWRSQGKHSIFGGCGRRQLYTGRPATRGQNSLRVVEFDELLERRLAIL